VNASLISTVAEFLKVVPNGTNMSMCALVMFRNNDPS